MRSSYFWAAQYNEYKLFFEHGLVWLEVALVGHINIRLLCALGNGFVLLLAILLWKMFLPNHKNFADRLTFLIPVSWLLFQLQYVETLNWAMASLQNLPVLVFSLSAIYLLMRTSGRMFCAALVCLTLSIASSGNGLLMIPVGILILSLDRRYSQLASWLVVSAGCASIYAFRYTLVGSQNRAPNSYLSRVTWSLPLHVIAFIGNAAAFPLHERRPLLSSLFCLFLGLVLCMFFVAIARRGYVRRNPLISYCVLFLLLTAVGVAGLRSQSLNSRYGIYSALLLIFAWFAIVEEFLQHKSPSLRRSHTLLGAIGAAALFCLVMDFWGWLYLAERNGRISFGMAMYERSIFSEFQIGPVARVPRQDVRLDELDKRAPIILKQSTELGIYRLSRY